MNAISIHRKFTPTSIFPLAQSGCENYRHPRFTSAFSEFLTECLAA
ncbi:hypothetical protein RSSM_04737 [Rhodopirellula sallentina SM41]|uniref:Uncharacterized protein n=1 Tax=Rhodopirellula sallentina SM41 TaxID=1263870 RepID=M5UCV9_9BACT|nr:hypothetical protein RSSM_04737 [Rhodopirellula sallentina SM41]